MNNAWQAIKKHKAIDDNFDKSSDYESNPLSEVLKLEIPEHWDVVPLSQVTDYQEGPGILAKDFTENGIPLLRLRNIEGTTVKLEGCNFLDKNKVSQKWAHFALQEGDLLISTSASLGRVSIVGPEAVGAIAYTGIIRFRSKSEKLDQNFLRAFLSSSVFVQQAEQMATGSVIRHFGPTHLKQMAIILPSLHEQVLIANIFDSFDKRISALSETNATLEAIAQALFKSWFIDFDPVHAKAEGRKPEGMDAETAALFPDGFEESELGLVPKGWGAKAVYDIATYINGASYRSFEPNDERRGLPIIKIAELKSGVTTQTRYSSVNMPDKYKINYGDILFSWSGNPDTSIDTFIWSQGAAWLNQHIFRVLPHSNQEHSFVLMTLRHLKPVFAEIARNKQTTGLGHVTIADLKRLKIVTPPSTILDRWNAVVTPILDQAFIMDCRSKILSHLRDTLLPRLISGQLIPDKVGEMV